MFPIQRLATRSVAVGLLAVLAIAGTACGDDDTTAKPTTAEFCLEAQQLDDGSDDGPYTEFYAKHPEPTPADWGADGNLVTASLRESIDQFKGLHPSDEAQPYVDEFIAAMEVGVKNSEDVTQAGKDGDQAKLDELERINQDTNVPAIMAAVEGVMQLCQATAGS